LILKTEKSEERNMKVGKKSILNVYMFSGVLSIRFIYYLLSVPSSQVSDDHYSWFGQRLKFSQLISYRERTTRDCIPFPALLYSHLEHYESKAANSKIIIHSAIRVKLEALQRFVQQKTNACGPLYRTLYSDSLRTEIEYWRGRDFPHLSRPTLAASPTSCSVSTGFLTGVTWPGCGVDHPPSSIVAQYTYTATSLWAFKACFRVSFIITFTPKRTYSSKNAAKTYNMGDSNADIRADLFL
jgi:hypothetical protein